MNDKELRRKIGNYAMNSVWDTVRGSVWTSVNNFVEGLDNSVWNLVRNSVKTSVWRSVKQKLETYE